MEWKRSLTTVILLLTLGRPSNAQTRPSFPMTFQQAVQHAIDNYPSIRASRARVTAQESSVALARTAYLPRLDYSIQINRATRNNVSGLLLPGLSLPSISGPVSDATSATSIWGSASGLLATWEAFDFGQRGASVDLARTLVTRANAQMDLTRLDVGVKTAEAFVRLAAAQETVRAARAHVERQEVFARSVATLVKHQLRAGADDSRAQAELALARIQLIQAEQAEHISRSNLAQWLGVDPEELEISAGPLLDTPPAEPSAEVSVPSHPLAETEMAAIESSRAIQHVLSRSYFPRINLQSAYALRGTGATANGTNRGGSEGLDFDTPNWAVGLTATLPVFDWFSLRERAQIEASNERAAVASYDRAVREVSAQVEQARAEINGARRIAENTPVQLAAARVLAQQSRARYDAGLASIIEVADSQRLLLQAEVGDAVARLDVWRALVADAAARGEITGLLK